MGRYLRLRGQRASQIWEFPPIVPTPPQTPNGSGPVVGTKHAPAQQQGTEEGYKALHGARSRVSAEGRGEGELAGGLEGYH